MKRKNNKQRSIINAGNNIFRAAFLKLTLGVRELGWGEKITNLLSLASD
jgi:hypothetical protein